MLAADGALRLTEVRPVAIYHTIKMSIITVNAYGAQIRLFDKAIHLFLLEGNPITIANFGVRIIIRSGDPI